MPQSWNIIEARSETKPDTAFDMPSVASRFDPSRLTASTEHDTQTNTVVIAIESINTFSLTNRTVLCPSSAGHTIRNEVTDDLSNTEPGTSTPLLHVLVNLHPLLGQEKTGTREEWSYGTQGAKCVAWHGVAWRGVAWHDSGGAAAVIAVSAKREAKVVFHLSPPGPRLAYCMAPDRGCVLPPSSGLQLTDNRRMNERPTRTIERRRPRYEPRLDSTRFDSTRLLPVLVPRSFSVCIQFCQGYGAADVGSRGRFGCVVSCVELNLVVVLLVLGLICYVQLTEARKKKNQSERGSDGGKPHRNGSSGKHERKRVHSGSKKNKPKKKEERRKNKTGEPTLPDAKSEAKPQRVKRQDGNSDDSEGVPLMLSAAFLHTVEPAKCHPDGRCPLSLPSRLNDDPKMETVSSEGGDHEEDEDV
ncbi:unnamed protein product [Soboliphyme baturini]|uniref:Transmembrane protein n=1 Tax=Soboliphyme baturini TaxID=241478 RepID=A0A183IMA3_9BILA|nr:unnamed protein product [Soboliphyme baturini]